jgi:hypothetical protein
MTAWSSSADSPKWEELLDSAAGLGNGKEPKNAEGKLFPWHRPQHAK